MARIGVIGGSGLYEMKELKVKDTLRVRTPFGEPSDEYTLCEYHKKEVVFLPRHGKDHRFSPSTVNYRANIYGMKKLGVTKIISIAACGSLKEMIKPLDLIIPHQFLDRTNQARKQTFFDEGIVAHVAFAEPICLKLAELVYTVTQGIKCCTTHWGGTYVNMEGPQFSTKAESNLYRRWGMDVVGMTNMTEARLAKEAEICYVTLATVTDFDCWHDVEESVTWEMIVDNSRRNVENAKRIVKEVIARLDPETSCPGCNEALKYAIVTPAASIPAVTKKKLELIIGKYT